MIKELITIIITNNSKDYLWWHHVKCSTEYFEKNWGYYYEFYEIKQSTSHLNYYPAPPNKDIDKIERPPM